MRYNYIMTQCSKTCYEYLQKAKGYLPVSTVVFQFFLATGKRVVGLAAVQPRHGTPDPVQQL